MCKYATQKYGNIAHLDRQKTCEVDICKYATQKYGNIVVKEWKLQGHACWLYTFLLLSRGWCEHGLCFVNGLYLQSNTFKYKLLFWGASKFETQGNFLGKKFKKVTMISRKSQDFLEDLGRFSAFFYWNRHI